MTLNIMILVLAMVLICSSAHSEESDAATDQNKLNVALLQMSTDGDNQAANLKKADEYCRKAAAMGADIALMPEMWNIGYSDYPGTTREDRGKWEAKAVARDSAYVKHFEVLAKELNMAIVVTYLEKWPKAPRNSATLIDRNGKQVFTYAKVHTCDFGKQEAACTPGDGFKVAELDTAKGKINVGIMICYDREFPESARVLMLKGAELILTPNACGLNDMRLMQFQVRAYENAVAVAMANYANPPHNGDSISFDEKARLLVHAPDGECVSIAPVDIAEIRDWHKKTIAGGAWRRTDHYGDITKNSELPVFERVNGFGEKFVSHER